MIDTCLHCGRPVANDEQLVRARSGEWIPTACAASDGPLCSTGSEVLTNHTHWYVSVSDAGKRGLLLGPYSSYDVAKTHQRRGYDLACGNDPFAHFYAFGVASMNHERTTVFGK